MQTMAATSEGTVILAGEVDRPDLTPDDDDIYGVTDFYAVSLDTSNGEGRSASRAMMAWVLATLVLTALIVLSECAEG